MGRHLLKLSVCSSVCRETKERAKARPQEKKQKSAVSRRPSVKSMSRTYDLADQSSIDTESDSFSEVSIEIVGGSSCGSSQSNTSIASSILDISCYSHSPYGLPSTTVTVVAVQRTNVVSVLEEEQGSSIPI